MMLRAIHATQHVPIDLATAMVLQGPGANINNRKRAFEKNHHKMQKVVRARNRLSFIDMLPDESCKAMLEGVCRKNTKP